MTERFTIHLVGNNPGELSCINHSLSHFDKARLTTTVSFDLQEGIKNIQRTRPNYILLDDCYPVLQLRKFIGKLKTNVKTQDIPIALLKSSNKSQILIGDIQDFLLKENFSGEQVFTAILNSKKIRRTQLRLYKSYLRGRNQYYSISSRFKRFYSDMFN